MSRTVIKVIIDQKDMQTKTKTDKWESNSRAIGNFFMIRDWVKMLATMVGQ